MYNGEGHSTGNDLSAFLSYYQVFNYLVLIVLRLTCTYFYKTKQKIFSTDIWILDTLICNDFVYVCTAMLKNVHGLVYAQINVLIEWRY